MEFIANKKNVTTDGEKDNSHIAEPTVSISQDMPLGTQAWRASFG